MTITVILSSFFVSAVSFHGYKNLSDEYKIWMALSVASTWISSLTSNTSTAVIENKLDKLTYDVSALTHTVNTGFGQMVGRMNTMDGRMNTMEKDIQDIKTILSKMENHMAAQDPTFVKTTLMPPAIMMQDTQFPPDVAVVPDNGPNKRKWTIHSNALDAKREDEMQTEREHLIERVVPIPVQTTGVAGRFLSMIGWI